MEIALIAALTLILILACILVTLIPMFVAIARGHRNVGSITLLTLLLGGTGLGWIIALVWSMSDNCHA